MEFEDSERFIAGTPPMVKLWCTTVMRFWPIPTGVMLMLAACEARAPQTDSAAAVCPPEATKLVQQLGARMRRVSLLAPDSIVRREITSEYSGIAAAELVAGWQRDPTTAPGRDVSSPFPARIDVDQAVMNGSTCKVTGNVIFVTSSDTTSAVERRALTLELTDDGGWKIRSFDAETSPARATQMNDDDTPASVVRRYYAAIDARKYDDAYALWGREGSASGKTLAAFTAGFEETQRATVAVGDSIRIEGAAGSQYATVPVKVTSTLKSGATEFFTGSYTVRRSMVDGATPAQRAWHIDSATLRRVPGPG